MKREMAGLRLARLDLNFVNNSLNAYVKETRFTDFEF